MLNAYLDARGGKMSGEELGVFEKLLVYPDQVLQGLLMGLSESADTDIMGLVDGIQEVVRQQQDVAAQ